MIVVVFHWINHVVINIEKKLYEIMKVSSAAAKLKYKT